MTFGKWLIGEIDWKSKLVFLKAISFAVVSTLGLVLFVWYSALFFSEYCYVNKIHEFVFFTIIILVGMFPFALVYSLFFIRKKYKIYKQETPKVKSCKE